jgi:ATP-dependent DNA ligase
VYLQSRSGKSLSSYFPEITRAVRTATPAGTVLDGELVIWEPDRQRTSFALLQRRITAGARVLQLARTNPAHYVVFDLLADQHGQLLDQPLATRRERLATLLAGAPASLQLSPQTTDPNEAREWLEPGAPPGSRA